MSKNKEWHETTRFKVAAYALVALSTPITVAAETKKFVKEHPKTILVAATATGTTIMLATYAQFDKKFS